MAGRTRRALVLLAALLAMAAGCGSSGSGGHGAAPTSTPSSRPSSGESPGLASTVAWTPCQSAAGPKGFQCATIRVPRDPQNPSLGTIGMALDRRPASGPKIGSLLVNPGGPGASGVDYLPYVVKDMPASLLARFDVVGFDPPGVGRTAPIVCLDPAGLQAYFHADPAPTTPAGLGALIAQDRQFADGCQSRSGAELPYVSTVDAAMDMDVIRQDLGDAKLTYLGFSYGTYLGATYAGLYPTHIRAMVLDGAIDPSLPVITGIDDQSVAINADLDSLLASCAASSSCPWQPGGDLRSAYQALAASVRAHPLAVPGTSRTVGPSELLYATAFTLYSTTTWIDLEVSLAQAAGGDGSDLLQLFDAYVGRNPDGTYSNEFEANAAVNCLDSAAPSQAQIEAAAPAAARLAPVFGVANVYSELGCTVWPVKTTAQPAPIHAFGSPPIVVVGTTGDPATPYAEAQGLAAQLQHGVLLTRVGEGHTAYPYSSCIRTYVDAYLISLTPPPAGTRCSSNG